VIFVSRDPTPDVSSQLITDYAVSRKGGAGPWRIRQIPQLQGALVAMDPHTGRVFAMTGGYSFQASQFNRAVQAKRQPGSSFKPFVYAAALENGWTPSSRVLDAPYVSCDPTQKECYKPANYTQKFYGLSTLRFGVETSKNAMTVRLASDLGFEKVSEMGERMGIYDKLPAYESMSLGAGETTPIRMVTAYAELVNGGKQVHPVMFDRIQNRYGETVFRTDARPCEGCATQWQTGLEPPQLPDERKQLMDPVTAYQMVSILEGAVEHSWGTVTTARSVGKPVGGKSGTTNDYMDAWTVGFSPDLVVGVWIGNDKSKSIGDSESGGRVAAPIFRDFMLAALKDKPPVNFRIPADVQLVEVDLYSGCLPTPASKQVILEAFKIDSGPKETCQPGGGGEGYSVDYSDVVAGDESAPSTLDGQTPQSQAPGPDVASTTPVDPNAPPVQQPETLKPDLNVNSPVY
jgi:penicillin-binding protein 1A